MEKKKKVHPSVLLTLMKHKLCCEDLSDANELASYLTSNRVKSALAFVKNAGYLDRLRIRYPKLNDSKIRPLKGEQAHVWITQEMDDERYNKFKEYSSSGLHDTNEVYSRLAEEGAHLFSNQILNEFGMIDVEPF